MGKSIIDNHGLMWTYFANGNKTEQMNWADSESQMTRPIGFVQAQPKSWKGDYLEQIQLGGQTREHQISSPAP